MQIEVTRDVINALARAAEAAHPAEACGILLGDGVTISQFTETRNVHPEPLRHFEIDPQALIDAHRAARQSGPQIMGYFHSHPHGPARPSQTDAECASGDGLVWAISGQDEISWWCDEVDGFGPVSYMVSDA